MDAPTLTPSSASAPPVTLDSRRVAALCERFHVSRLWLFGSVLRPDFGPDSDADILVEFVHGATPGLGFFTLEQELSQLLGRPVDLNMPDDLPPVFRDDVRRSARLQYEVE